MVPGNLCGMTLDYVSCPRCFPPTSCTIFFEHHLITSLSETFSSYSLVPKRIQTSHPAFQDVCNLTPNYLSYDIEVHMTNSILDEPNTSTKPKHSNITYISSFRYLILILLFDSFFTNHLCLLF